MNFANNDYTRAIQLASSNFLNSGNMDAYNDQATAAFNKLNFRRGRCADAFDKCCSGGY